MTNWYYPPPPPPEVPRTIFDNIEAIKSSVARYFPIYNVQVHFDTISLYCTVERSTLEDNFEKLRMDLKPMSYIPLITEERGEFVIHVVKNPPSKFRGPWLNLILLIATIASTVIAGSGLWSATFNSGSVLAGENLANGALYFALPLMLILGIHEMGHYMAARHHKVAASLPFFIPAPFILGTMGAFISIREPIPSKKALLDIGVAGPIAGFVVAIPVLLLGLMLSGDMPASVETGTLQGGTMLIGDSVLFRAIIDMFAFPGNVNIHPLAFAGWVGFFVTALNLLPIGQLDGGHIARALMGERAKWAGYAAMGAMLVLFFLWTNWLFFLFILLLMGLKHPPPLNDVTQLTGSRKIVGVAAAVMLVLCFVPVPLSTVPVNHDFTFQQADATPVGPFFSHSIDKPESSTWQNISYPFRIVNNGNMPLELKFVTSVNATPVFNGTEFFVSAWLTANGNANATGGEAGEYLNTTLDIGETLNMTLRIEVSPAEAGTELLIEIAETGYDWESAGFYTDSRDPHGMRFTVTFS